MPPLLKPAQVRRLLKLAHGIDRVSEVAGRIANWLVILTIAVGFYNVLARYVGRFIGLKLASNALIELQWYLFSLVFLLGFTYILKHGENVRVDFLYTHWSEKRKAWIDLAGTVLFLIPFCVIGLWVTFNPVLSSWGRLPDGSWGQWEISTDADGLPRAPIKSMMIVGFVLLLAQGIAQAIKYVAVLQGYSQAGEELRDEIEEIPYE